MKNIKSQNVTPNIGEIYRDEHLGLLIFMGRTGYELNLPNQKKGKHLFRLLDMKKTHFVVLTKKELNNLINES
jgi:hypothetical protein